MSLQLQEVALNVDGNTHIYPTSIELEKASLNVLLGATQSGKTSLMRVMAGLERPTAGSVIWQGEDVTGMHVRKRDVAMVYQQFINYPSFTVFDNIASPLKIKKFSKKEIDIAVRSVAEMLKLTPFLQRTPLELSGGQQQRCALARALVKKSGLVLLDEPLANLDYKLREELRAEIPRIFEQSGAIFVYATTEPEEALLLGGNTATLYQGRVTQFGATPSVYHRPLDRVTATAFSDPPMNFTSLLKHDNTIRIGDSQLDTNSATAKLFESLGEGEYVAGFRPNHLTLRGQSSGAIQFQTRLDITEITGSETFLHLQHSDAKWVGLVHGVHDLPMGAQVDVYLDPGYIYVFNTKGQLVANAEYAHLTEIKERD